MPSHRALPVPSREALLAALSELLLMFSCDVQPVSLSEAVILLAAEGSL
ncbi:hypothetical protein ACIBG0_09810 [Nocardia sp. NPDC050630]